MTACAWARLVNQCSFRHSSRNRPLKDSSYAFCVGLPGSNQPQRDAALVRPGRAWRARRTPGRSTFGMMRSRQDKCFSRMGLPQLRPEETASHDLEIFYHVASRAGSDRCCEADPPGAAGAARAASGARCASRTPRPRSTASWRRSAPSTCRARSRSSRPATTIGRWPTSSGRPGFSSALVSSIAVARTREALYNSWDKNDPKDAQVILHLLKNGTTQRYLDPLVTGHHDLQEMANTYQQVSLRKVRLQHSLDHAPLAAVLSRSRAVSAQLARRVVHRAAALHAVSGGRAPATPKPRSSRPRATQISGPQGRQSAVARRLL